MNRKLAKMQKMEEILGLILGAGQTLPSRRELAAHLGCHEKSFERIFAGYFEIPYATFIRSLRLRRAAREMIQKNSVSGLWETYHFSSHSNYIRMFHKEFGVTPKHFLDGRMKVPDMPERKLLLGMELKTEYKSLPNGEYAVFSYPFPSSPEDVGMCSFFLNRYVFLEWQPLNQKQLDPERYPFELLAEDRVSLYVPLVAKTEMSQTPQVDTGNGSASWAPYIDAHIWENLTPESLAETFYYSVKHFVRVFHLVYAVTPVKYICKRRLSLIAREVRRNPFRAEKICQKHGYASIPQFEQAYFQEFGVSPEVAGSEYHAVDIMKYYEENLPKLKMSIQEFSQMYIDGKILASQVGAEDEESLPEQAAEDFIRQQKDTGYELLASAWYEDGTEPDKIEYVLGPVYVTDTDEHLSARVLAYDNKKAAPSDDRRICLLAGGTYAVFEIDCENDEDVSLAEAFHMMNRVVFYGWIIRNRDLWDGSRTCFTMYKSMSQNGQKKKKLYFCVPVLTPVIP